MSKHNFPCSDIVSGVMTWGVWGHHLSTAAIQETIETCLSLGITTFDHADIYGHYTTEADFGAVLKQHAALREKMQLVSKCGINLVTPNRPANRIKSYNTSREHILKSVDQSLINLHTDYLDVLLIHRPSPLMNYQEIAEAFQHLKALGKVKYFGVSNFLPHQFEALNALFPLVTNQVECSILTLDPIYDGTFDQCQQLGTSAMIWSPLAGGKLFQKQFAESNPTLHKTATTCCEKYDIEPDQLLLAWLLKHPAKLIPVIGTSKKDRLKRAVDTLETSISNEDWFAILEASVGHEVP